MDVHHDIANGLYASANSCALRSKRFISTEHVQLKLNYCVARTHLPAKPSWSTTSATAPRSAVKATRNALGLPDDFTGTVAGGDLAIFRANGATIFKSAIIKRLQRALKRAGIDPDLHSGTACAKAERRISSMPASSCSISCAGGRGPKAAPHCAFTAMSLLLLGLAGPSGPPMAHAQDRASNPTCWTSIKSSWQFVIGPRLHRVRPSSPRLRIVWV